MSQLSEAIETLQECQKLLDGVSAKDIDDPEEFMIKLTCEGSRFSDAAAVVIEAAIKWGVTSRDPGVLKQ